MMRKFLLSTLAAALLAAPLLPTAVADLEEGTQAWVTSFDGTQIDINVCKPAGASAETPVPVILHSHGWGGSKSGCGSFDAYYDDGFGVVSISQRGFGASGGQANVHDPDLEGRDNIAVIDYVATLDWVAMDGPNDPVLGAIGGSYGGGFQFLTAFLETYETGSTRLNAIAPEITWFDLRQSLAPNGVVRTAWVAALYAAGAASLPQYVHEGFLMAAATGNAPEGIWEEFYSHGPVWYTDQDIKLSIPALIGQGFTDNLFNMNQGHANFVTSFTEEARADSYFVGYNGGHVLPGAFPLGGGASGDPCSQEIAGGSFGALARQFFANQLLGVNHALPATAYSLASEGSAGSTCLHVDSMDANAAYDVAGPIVSPTGIGAPQHVPIVTAGDDGLTVAGIPELEASWLSAGLDQRLFFALSRGTTQADALVVANNWMPWNSEGPIDMSEVHFDMAGVAVELQPGETLFLTVAPLVDQFAAMGSRLPGAAILQDVVVHLPVQG